MPRGIYPRFRVAKEAKADLKEAQDQQRRKPRRKKTALAKSATTSSTLAFIKSVCSDCGGPVSIYHIYCPRCGVKFNAED